MHSAGTGRLDVPQILAATWLEWERRGGVGSKHAGAEPGPHAPCALLLRRSAHVVVLAPALASEAPRAFVSCCLALSAASADTARERGPPCLFAVCASRRCSVRSWRLPLFACPRCRVAASRPMHSFHPFGASAASASPQRGAAPAIDAASNPFSDPRLLETRPSPGRHASPYELARAHQTTSTQAAFAQAERAADHHSFSSAGDAGRMGITSETDAYLASLVQGGSDDLKRLSLGGNSHHSSSSAGGGGVSPQRQPSSHSALLHRSPASAATAAAATANAAGYSSPPRSHAFAAAAAVSPSHHHSPLVLSGARGSPLESQEQFYYDLLKHAREGDCAAVQSLLQSATSSFDVDFADRDGDSALHRACAGGHLGMVHYLVLECGANIHATNRHGDMPLIVNLRGANPSPAVVKFLVECGSDIHATNAQGVSAASCVASSAQATTGAVKPIHALNSNTFLFGSSASLSPVRPGASASSTASADLVALLQEAQSNPVRQFVLNQTEEIRQLRAQLDAAAAQVQSQQIAGQQLEAQRATQDSQLRQMHASLSACHTRLTEMDAGLDRLAREQTDAASASGSTVSAAPVVLISEVRSALIRVRNTFPPTMMM